MCLGSRLGSETTGKKGVPVDQFNMEGGVTVNRCWRSDFAVQPRKRKKHGGKGRGWGRAEKVTAD